MAIFSPLWSENSPAVLFRPFSNQSEVGSNGSALLKIVPLDVIIASELSPSLDAAIAAADDDAADVATDGVDRETGCIFTLMLKPHNCIS